ncbi:MAG TPA: NAD(P)H-binding protein [Puia sp.]|nr:NAD(P)H-binding protein [Puia sp.]
MSKYVITGGAGHVSKPLAEILLKAGHDVTVVGRNPDHLAGLVKQGAKAAIGDLFDVPFLTKVFEGADGVYLMLPPSWDKSDLKEISKVLAGGFAKAVKDAGVKDVVFLSSYGAHRLEDAGAISGLGLAEIVLNGLDAVNVLSLRAGYFYTNLLLSIDLIRTEGIMGNMFTIPAGTFTVVDPEDIAVAAAEALIAKNFKGHSFKYVVSDLTGTDEIATAFGKEIGLPDLKWVKLPAADLKSALLHYGFNDGAANDYVEMFTTLNTGLLFEDFFAGKHKFGGVSIGEYAKKFKAIYNGK